MRWSVRAETVRRAAAAVVTAAALHGCASGALDSVRAYGSVAKLPPVTALRGQSAWDQQWDVKDCQAEAGYRTNYSPTDSPMANLFQKLFFWGTAGAAVGGTASGFPTVVDTSTASTGLIAGASAGGATGAALSLGGQSAYERAWRACIEARGYAVDATPASQRTP